MQKKISSCKKALDRLTLNHLGYANHILHEDYKNVTPDSVTTIFTRKNGN